MLTLIYVIVILVFATIFGEIAEHYHQPNILGQLLGGLIAGPIALSLFALILGAGHPMLKSWDVTAFEEQIRVLIDLGMIMVMLIAGLETDVEGLFKAGRYFITTAVGGVILPFAAGLGVGFAFDFPTITALFIGASLSITAVAVSAKTLLDLKQLRTRIGATVMGAAVIDDILGVMILAVLLSIIRYGRLPSFVSSLLILVKSLGFLIIGFWLGRRLSPYLFQKIHGMLRATRFGVILFVVLLYSLAAHFFGLHAMIGAYIAGLVLKGTLSYSDEEKLSAWGLGFFAPLFFGWIGFSVRFAGLLSLLALVVILVAVAGKLLGAGLGALVSGLSRREALGVGIAMNGRGAVELVLVSVGLEYGIISEPLFSIIVFMAFLTTIATPFGLKFVVKTSNSREKEG